MRATVNELHFSLCFRIAELHVAFFLQWVLCFKFKQLFIHCLLSIPEVCGVEKGDKRSKWSPQRGWSPSVRESEEVDSAKGMTPPENDHSVARNASISLAQTRVLKSLFFFLSVTQLNRRQRDNQLASQLARYVDTQTVSQIARYVDSQLDS